MNDKTEKILLPVFDSTGHLTTVTKSSTVAEVLTVDRNSFISELVAIAIDNDPECK